MTEQDANDLRALGMELAEAARSPWEPRCVAAAFSRHAGPWVFRMQTWVDLEAVQSPFLLGEMPEAEEALYHFRKAFEAFGYEGTTPEECDAEGLLLLGARMVQAISNGFAMRVPVAPAERDMASTSSDEGLGEFLPILACLVTQMGFRLDDALQLPVGRAFALIVAHRVNQGWRVTGESYATRDIPEDPSDG